MQQLKHRAEMPIDPLVFKIIAEADWLAARTRGAYAGSADDIRDGFIHLSSLSQIAGTLAKHFATAPDLLLVAFNGEKLGAPLRYEKSSGGALFPHYYAALPTDLALWTAPIRLKSDGSVDCDHENFSC